MVLLELDIWIRSKRHYLDAMLHGDAHTSRMSLAYGNSIARYFRSNDIRDNHLTVVPLPLDVIHLVANF